MKARMLVFAGLALMMVGVLIMYTRWPDDRGEPDPVYAATAVATAESSVTPE